MAEPFAVTTETFENEVLKSDVPVLVDGSRLPPGSSGE